MAASSSGTVLRRATIACLGTALLALGALWVLFGALLQPPADDGCRTSLAPGSYRDAMVPAHLAAAAAIAVAVLRLHVARRDGRVRPWARAALGTAALVVAGSLVWEDGWGVVVMVAMLASVSAAPALVLALAIRTTLAERRGRRRGRGRAAREADHAGAAEAVGWLAFGVGVPAAFGFAWVNGASLFCF